MEKLVLVGNGFDMAHGLMTSYENFADNNKDNPDMVAFCTLVDSVKEDDIFLKEEGKRKDDVTWYDFEENIELISTWMFRKNFRDNRKQEEFENLDQTMACYNKVFERVSDLLVAYLADEFSSKKIEKIKSVEKEITPNSYVISFNYTDTIKMYTHNYNFVHGSINDDRGNIILGFPRNDVSDLSTNEYIKHKKDILRERLSFSRFLRKNNYVEVEKLLQEFELHLNCLFGGKGEYNFPEKNTANGMVYDTHLASEAIIKYAKNNNFRPAKDKGDYSDVREIVIMGHGLEADLHFIESLFKKAVSLETIKLFSYEGETDSEISRKKRTLEEISNINNIKVLQY